MWDLQRERPHFFHIIIATTSAFSLACIVLRSVLGELRQPYNCHVKSHKLTWHTIVKRRRQHTVFIVYCLPTYNIVITASIWLGQRYQRENRYNRCCWFRISHSISILIRVGCRSTSYNCQTASERDLLWLEHGYNFVLKAVENWISLSSKIKCFVTPLPVLFPYRCKTVNYVRTQRKYSRVYCGSFQQLFTLDSIYL